ncbi:MAG: Crp/Fnr family transcriptional regulator [Leptothrix ochracea]|uniref:Crp/Fnr family transcriptional regulator n=1 Tax=Leptothrix ochracea TaxID=735331 RepID=UPI0034E23DF9
MGSRRLRPRGSLIYEVGDRCGLMMLLEGFVLVESGNSGHGDVACLALPGDLLAVEALLGLTQRGRSRALVPCVVAEIQGCDTAGWADVLARSQVTQQQRLADTARLLQGSAGERVRHLLTLLCTGSPNQGEACRCELPVLADMARLINTAPETVSRVLGQFRRAGLVESLSERELKVSMRLITGAPLPEGLTRSRINDPQ